MDADELAVAGRVMLDASHGSKIECRERGTVQWRPISDPFVPRWNWHSFEYRVAEG